jgi:hypothetical protein
MSIYVERPLPQALAVFTADKQVLVKLSLYVICVFTLMSNLKSLDYKPALFIFTYMIVLTETSSGVGREAFPTQLEPELVEWSVSSVCMSRAYLQNNESTLSCFCYR